MSQDIEGSRTGSPDRNIESTQIETVLELVGLGLPSPGARRSSFSGGMRQQIANRRAAIRPSIPFFFLLDEALGALQTVSRRQLKLELQRIFDEEQVTAFLITRRGLEQEAVPTTPDRIVVLQRTGKVESSSMTCHCRAHGP